MTSSIASGIAQRSPRSARNEDSPVPVVPPVVARQENRINPVGRSTESAAKGELRPNGTVHTAKILVAVGSSALGSALAEQLEKAGYRNLLAAGDPENSWKIVRQHHPDLVVMDISNPPFQGQELLRRVRFDSQTQNLPVIAVSASHDGERRTQALTSGATDCLTVPWEPLELSARVRTSLLVKLQMDRLSGFDEEVRVAVRRCTEELAATQEEIIQCLARAGEYRDHETGYHVLRVGRFAGAISRQLGLPDDQIRLLEQAAQLHDVGKIGISDLVLLKPGRLSPEEFALIKKHCEFGRDIIQPLRIQSEGGQVVAKCEISRSPVMAMAARIAMTHHEWWNGAGYPRGLSGEEIPLEGRITAVADVFDALCSQRPYKPAFPSETCFRMMEQNRGIQFDPRVFDAFVAARDEILAIRQAIPDPPRMGSVS